jgi:hypothetical protein
MHGRCDTDPLDFATDVCDDCGGEQCGAHLVHPHGPSRPPLCRSCAIAISGVRTGAAPGRKRTRSQIKRRRAELRQQRTDQPVTLGFEPFELRPEPADADDADREQAAGEEAEPLDPSPSRTLRGRSLAQRLGLGRQRPDRGSSTPVPEEPDGGSPDAPVPGADQQADAPQPGAGQQAGDPGPAGSPDPVEEAEPPGADPPAGGWATSPPHPAPLLPRLRPSLASSTSELRATAGPTPPPPDAPPTHELPRRRPGAPDGRDGGRASGTSTGGTSASGLPSRRGPGSRPAA